MTTSIVKVLFQNKRINLPDGTEDLDVYIVQCGNKILDVRIYHYEGMGGTDFYLVNAQRWEDRDGVFVSFLRDLPFPARTSTKKLFETLFALAIQIVDGE